MLHLLPMRALSRPLAASPWCEMPGAGGGDRDLPSHPGEGGSPALRSGVASPWGRGMGVGVSQAAPCRVRGAEGISHGQEEAQAASPLGSVPSSLRGTGRGLQHHFKWHFFCTFYSPFKQINLTPVWYRSPLCCPVSAQQGQAWGWGGCARGVSWVLGRGEKGSWTAGPQHPTGCLVRTGPHRLPSLSCHKVFPQLRWPEREGALGEQPLGALSKQDHHLQEHKSLTGLCWLSSPALMG